MQGRYEMSKVKSIARGAYKKLMKEARARKASPEKLSSQVGDAVFKARQKAGRVAKNLNMEDVDKKMGEALTSAKKSAKKLGEKVGATAKNIKKAGRSVKDTGKWIGKNKGKAALVSAAVGGGAYAMSKDDDQIKKIKAKDPSERTAAEKRLLRLMED